MATVAATIADGGQRPQPTFTLDAAPPAGGGTREQRGRRAHRAAPDDRRRARRHRHRRRDPRRDGRRQDGHRRTEEPRHLHRPRNRTRARRRIGRQRNRASESCQAAQSEASNTDAWFAAFAPALDPRIVVGVMLVKDGAGGATAAPVAREVLEAGCCTRREQLRRRARPRPFWEASFGIDDLQLQRPVVERDDLDLVEQQRALRWARRRRPSSGSGAGFWPGPGPPR